jgi:hypothetical protein
MRKLMLLAAVAVGYVLGARAGRERYEQIRRGFVTVKDNPTVRSAAASVADTAKEQAPVVKDKLAETGSAAFAKVKPGGSPDDELVDQLHPDSTARQSEPYPQGTLP